jgi:tetraacyldisaccharide 4'-kinase
MQRASAGLQRLWGARSVRAWLLVPLAVLYGVLGGLRRLCYRRGWLPTCTLPVPVVVVGNLIVGGAGKTPTVIALVELLRRHGWHPGIVSRGYGGQADGVIAVEAATPAAACGDEPLLLRLRTGAPVFVGRDRVGAGRALLAARPDIDVIVADDGLQHLRLHRDLQVLVFDERGAGNGWLLPAGPLREPLPQGLPERSLVLYNAGAPTTPLPGATAERRLAGAVALADWWQGRPPQPEALAGLQGRKVIAAAGLARPERFHAMLREAGLDIEPLALPDHFDYAALPWPTEAADVVVTEKDAVKIAPGRGGTTRVWVVALDFRPAPAFDAEVLRLLGPPSRPR